MKIAIVTFWDSQDNYGQIMQAYALCQFLTNEGHSPFIIRYKYRESHTLKYMLRSPYVCMLRLREFVSNPVVFIDKRRQIQEAGRHNRGFDAFRSAYIPMSERVFNQHELMKAPPEAEIYVSGSDQIWSLLDSVYFLQFAPAGKRCVAYGSSCGGKEFNDGEKSILKRYIERYSFIGLRESRDTDLIKELGGAQATTVVDPTLLLSVEDYNKIADTGQSKGKYILVYLISNKFDLDMGQIYSYAKQHGLNVKYVASQGRYDNFEKVYPTPQEWLGLVRNATHVVTNSFHGTVFSLLYGRNFTVIPQKGSSLRMNARIYDLLRPLSLDNRIFKGDFDILSNQINYEVVDKNLARMIKESTLKLLKQL